MNNSIIIVGGFHEIIELAEEINAKIIGLIDNSRIGNYFNYPVLGTDDDIDKVYNQNGSVPVVITPDKPSLREKLYLKYQNKGFSFASLVSNQAKLSLSATFEQGTIIQAGVNVSSEVTVGEFVKLNSCCNIMHNVVVGDFTTIAPNAVILGNVKISKSCYIGANSTILPGINIGNNVIIGAGTVVTKDVPDGKTMVGNPARELMQTK